MEDESASLDGKGLLNMRVVDLKQELEKRGLSKSGSKKDLVKRLKQQLEFEKLCEERKSGDFPLKLELDAEIQQNEFVQQYLAQQQKRYAERQEEKRLELEATQKGHEEGSTITSEHQGEHDENTSSDVDDKTDEKQNLIMSSSENETQGENTDDTNVTSVKSSEFHNRSLNKSKSEIKTEIIKETIPSQNPEVSECDSDGKNNYENTQPNKADRIENIQNVNNITEIENIKLMSKDHSETDTKSIVTELKKVTDNSVCTADNTGDSKNQECFEVNISNQSFDEKDPKVSIETDNELRGSGKCQSNSSFASEVGSIASHSVSPVKDSSEYLLKQKTSGNMEVSADCSSVPYSLSDIQLPESPDHNVKSKDSKCEDRSKVDHLTDEPSRENSHSDSKNKSNGKTAHKSNSSEEEVSDSEAKDSSYNTDSPEKIKMTKAKRHSEESSDSESDRNSSPYKKKSSKDEDISSNLAVDSDNNHSENTPVKEKCIKGKKNKDESDNGKSSDSEEYKRKVNSKRKFRDKSSDSEKYNRQVDSKHKAYDKSSGFVKHSRQSDSKHKSRDSEKSSDSERHSSHVDTKRKSCDSAKSSDSEKYRHVDSNRKSRDKCRKRDSRSSSSSSSSSSDNSSERKHSKKSVPAKNKDFPQDDESNQISDKSSDEKSKKHKENNNATESLMDTSDTTVSIKKRLKIKRDNVPIEISSKKESLSPKKETLSPKKQSSSPKQSMSPIKKKISSSKSVEKSSSTHSASDKIMKQEFIEKKEEENLEMNYTPRKIVLSNRKLNRKSEDNSTEPRCKKNKWESFASAQKYSQTYDMSTDALRNWFPDFKLVSETSMDVEQDEQSLSAIDEKNDDTVPGEILNENESSMKQESSFQVDKEDSFSQEHNFDDNPDLGPVSKIIFIQNLVRPFTLNQLKDLLKQNGKIIEEYFWIDKIKSKCFVMYETEKEAIKARNTLNNTRWPSSNPKILSVEFSSIDELEKHQKGNEPQPLKPPESPAIESSDNLEARISHAVEDHKRKDRERRKEKERTKLQAPIREWDKDKIVQVSPERERARKEEKPRSAEKKEKKESKKRATEDTPAKLLDDLFQKTKSVPCIYWLPLTEEQAKAKDEEKKMRRLEREKRNQQLREQEEAERRSRRARSSSRRREKENQKSSTRSRSPVSRRR